MESKLLKKLIERRHPDYQDSLGHWTFLEETYYGGRDWFKKHIFQYFKEGPDEYQSRINRAYRFNHTREIVDLVNKYLFRAEIARNKDAPELLQKFWKSATRAGLSADEFARVISTKGSIFGRVWVVVDNAMKLKEGESIEDLSVKEASNRSRIYAYIVRPTDVLDYSLDEVGELNWILIQELHRDDEDPFTESKGMTPRYRLWTRDSWFLIEQEDSRRKTYKITDDGKHNLGMVPVVPYDNMVMDNDDPAPSLIADIAYLDRAAANYVSNLDAIIQDQTFSQLTLPAQSIMPGDDSDKKMIEAGTKRIFTYDASSGGKPEFISPDPKQASLILGVVRQIISEIYSSVGLASENTKTYAQGMDNGSGVAKSRDFERVNALLMSKADSLELVENRIAKVVCAWAGEEVLEGDVVQYSDTFDVRDLYDEFYIAMQLALIEMPLPVRREQMILLLDKLFPQMEKAKRDKIVEEIKVWEPSEQSEQTDTISNVKSKLQEEAKRDRVISGGIQSQTKSRVSGSDNNALTE